MWLLSEWDRSILPNILSSRAGRALCAGFDIFCCFPSFVVVFMVGSCQMHCQTHHVGCFPLIAIQACSNWLASISLALALHAKNQALALLARTCIPFTLFRRTKVGLAYQVAGPFVACKWGSKQVRHWLHLVKQSLIPYEMCGLCSCKLCNQRGRIIAWLSFLKDLKEWIFKSFASWTRLGAQLQIKGERWSFPPAGKAEKYLRLLSSNKLCCMCCRCDMQARVTLD